MEGVIKAKYRNFGYNGFLDKLLHLIGAASACARNVVLRGTKSYSTP